MLTYSCKVQFVFPNIEIALNTGITVQCMVAVDPCYLRPTEVETLLGDPTKARVKLGWTPKTSFAELVAEMVREDLKGTEKDELVKRHGFASFERHE